MYLRYSELKCYVARESGIPALVNLEVFVVFSWISVHQYPSRKPLLYFIDQLIRKCLDCWRSRKCLQKTTQLV